MTTTTAPFFHVTRPRRSLVPDMRRPEPSPLPRPEWSLFSSHTLVLAALAADPEVRIREIAHVAGLVVLLAIMVLAFKNDIERQWPAIVEVLSQG